MNRHHLNQDQTSMRNGSGFRLGIGILVATLTVSQVGCMLFANVLRVVGANQTPAQYDELEDTKIAVIAVGDSSQYSDDVAARLLSRKVSEILLEEVDGVRLIREDKIDQWRDQNGWETLDFAAIGKGVGAEKVLAIEIANLQLRGGSNLYRGQADVNIMVLDAESGDVLFRKQVDEFQYPVSSGGQSTTETTESRFRKLYMTILAKHIARYFHAFDPADLFALDGMMASQ